MLFWPQNLCTIKNVLCIFVRTYFFIKIISSKVNSIRIKAKMVYILFILKKIWRPISFLFLAWALLFLSWVFRNFLGIQLYL